MEKILKNAMVTSNDCPLCGSNMIIELFEAKDWLVTQQNFTIYGCKSCDFRFTNPRPADNDLSSYYENEDYVSHSEKATNLINRLFLFVRRFNVEKKIKIVKKYSHGKKLLDYGAGNGYFLFHARKNGFDIFGVEPNKMAREIAKKNYQVDLWELSQIDPSQKVDIITLWHVLEHLPDFKTHMRQFQSILNEKGTLILALPNFESHDATYFKEAWAALDVPRHLWHFSPKHIKILAEKFGFYVEKIIPMPFDVYYITMLSFRNKTGKSKLVFSLILGSFWNLKSIFSHRYSSLIYILRKK